MKVVVWGRDLGRAGPPDSFPADPRAEGRLPVDELRRRDHRTRHPLWWLKLP